MDDEKISDVGEPPAAAAVMEEGEFELSLLILCKANPDAADEGPEDCGVVAAPAVGNGSGNGKGVNCGLGGGIKALDEEDDVTPRLREETRDGMMNLSATLVLSVVFVLVVAGFPILLMLLVLSPALGRPRPRPNPCACPPRPPPVAPTIALGGDLAPPTPCPTPPLPSSLSSRTACLLRVGTNPCKSNEMNRLDKWDSSSSNSKLGLERYVAERFSEPRGWGRGENVCVSARRGGCEGEGGVSGFSTKKEVNYR